MTRQLVLLRAINVGKANRIKMADLRELCADLGFGDPRTHIQTGNVFLSTDNAPEHTAAQIERALAERHDVNTVAIVRVAADIAEAISAVPYPNALDDPKNHHIVYLAAEPDPNQVDSLDTDKWAPDRFEVVGRNLYLRFAEGASQSRMNVGALERALGVQGTARNLTVSQALLDMFADTGSA